MTSYIGITLTAAAVAGSSNVGMNGKYTISNSSGAHFEYGIGHRVSTLLNFNTLHFCLTF